MSKTDSQLGQRVHERLVQLGIETPMAQLNAYADSAAGRQERQESIESNVAGIMTMLGLDLADDSLVETPKRVAKMFMREIFSGLSYDNFPKCTVIDNKMRTDEMVLERGITLNSTCEHHLLPIIGSAHVAYIPGTKVLGLSKMNRIVKFFSQRPQVQERLTSQIHAALCYILETDDVAVIIEAEHMCVRTRGIEDACSDTVTSKLTGKFRESAMRQELMTFIKG